MIMALLAIVVIVPLLTGHEVCTHQGIVRVIATKSHRPVNLEHFLQDLTLGGIKGILPTGQFTLRHQLAANGKFPKESDWILGNDAYSIIEAGVVLEDSNLRPLRHFLDPTTGKGLLGVFDSAEQKAYNADWGLKSALDCYVQGLTAATPAKRLENQEDLFRSIGQIIHLMQDMTQPSHVRDDPHSGLIDDGVSALEIWELSDLRSSLSGEVTDAIEKYLAGHNSPLASHTAAQLISDLASDVNATFVSDDTMFTPYDHPCRVPSDCLDTAELQIDGDTFVVSLIPFNLGTELAYKNSNADGDSGVFGTGDQYELHSPGEAVLRDNAKSLLPLAARYSIDLINHFFRGRLSLSVSSSNPDDLVATNSSDLTVVADAAQVTFGEGKAQIFYETVDGTMVELKDFAIDQFATLPAGGAFTWPHAASGKSVIATLHDLRSSETSDSRRPKSNLRTVAVFRGKIGVEEGVAGAEKSFAPPKLVLVVDSSDPFRTQYGVYEAALNDEGDLQGPPLWQFDGDAPDSFSASFAVSREGWMAATRSDHFVGDAQVIFSDNFGTDNEVIVDVFDAQALDVAVADGDVMFAVVPLHPVSFEFEVYRVTRAGDATLETGFNSPYALKRIAVDSRGRLFAATDYAPLGVETAKLLRDGTEIWSGPTDSSTSSDVQVVERFDTNPSQTEVYFAYRDWNAAKDVFLRISENLEVTELASIPFDILLEDRIVGVGSDGSGSVFSLRSNIFDPGRTELFENDASLIKIPQLGMDLAIPPSWLDDR